MYGNLKSLQYSKKCFILLLYVNYGPLVEMFMILFIGKTVVTYLNANKKELLVHLLICKTLYFCGVLMKVSDDKLLKMERKLLITGSNIMVFQIRNCLLYVDCFVNW